MPTREATLLVRNYLSSGFNVSLPSRDVLAQWPPCTGSGSLRGLRSSLRTLPPPPWEPVVELRGGNEPLCSAPNTSKRAVSEYYSSALASTGSYQDWIFRNRSCAHNILERWTRENEVIPKERQMPSSRVGRFCRT